MCGEAAPALWQTEAPLLGGPCHLWSVLPTVTHILWCFRGQLLGDWHRLWQLRHHLCLPQLEGGWLLWRWLLPDLLPQPPWPAPCHPAHCAPEAGGDLHVWPVPACASVRYLKLLRTLAEMAIQAACRGGDCVCCKCKRTAAGQVIFIWQTFNLISTSNKKIAAKSQACGRERACSAALISPPVGILCADAGTLPKEDQLFVLLTDRLGCNSRTWTCLAWPPT